MTFDIRDKIPTKYLANIGGLPAGLDKAILQYSDATSSWEVVIPLLDPSNPSHTVLIDKDVADQHPIGAITDLQSILDGKADASHNHVISDIIDLQTELNNLYSALNSQTLEDHSDVEFTTLSDLEILGYDAGTSTWRNFNASIISGSGDNLGNHIATEDLYMSPDGGTNKYQIKLVAKGVDNYDAVNVLQLFEQRLNSHYDVDITSVQDNDVLYYDNASSTWKNTASTNLPGDNLGDHIARQAINMFDGVSSYKIVNLADGTDGQDAINKGQLDGAVDDITNQLTNLELFDLNDVSQASTLADMQVIIYDETSNRWINVDYSYIGDNLGNHTATEELKMSGNIISNVGQPVDDFDAVRKIDLSNINIGDLLNVTITAVDDGHFLIYDTTTSAWINTNSMPPHNHEISDVNNLQTELDSKLENIVEDMTPQLGGTLDCLNNDIRNVKSLSYNHVDLGSLYPSTPQNIDWTAASRQSLTLQSNLGGMTFTFTDPAVGGQSLILIIAQSDNGWLEINWPASVKWMGGTPPELSGSAGSEHLITMYYYSGKYLATTAADFH